MSRRADRLAARREARIRRAELRLFVAARRYGAALDRAAVEPIAQGGLMIEAQAELDAAALRYAETAPAPARRRRARARRSS